MTSLTPNKHNINQQNNIKNKHTPNTDNSSLININPLKGLFLLGLPSHSAGKIIRWEVIRQTDLSQTNVESKNVG